MVGVPCLLDDMALRTVGADGLALALTHLEPADQAGPMMKLISSAVRTAPPVRNVR